jgi:hypothetical protein
MNTTKQGTVEADGGGVPPPAQSKSYAKSKSYAIIGKFYRTRWLSNPARVRNPDGEEKDLSASGDRERTDKERH